MWRFLPNRIDRYLTLEILGPFGMSLGFLYFLLLTLQLMRGIEIMFGAGVGWRDFLLIALYQAPHLLVMAMPISLLFAVVLGVGRLSEDRETVALIASGVAPARLFVAPLVLGLACAGVGLWMSHGPDPQGLAALQGHVNNIIKQNMVGDIKPGVFYTGIRNMTIYASKRASDGQGFSQLMISDDRDPEASVLTLADRGQFDPMGSSGLLSMNLGAGEMHRSVARGGDYAVVGFESGAINIDLGRTLDQKNRFGRAREELTPTELKRMAVAAREAGKVGAALKYDVARERRRADPWAAVVFALCGVPLAMGRRGSARAVGALATIGAYVGYYVVARAGEAQAFAGNIPPVIAAQMANFLFLVVAIVLIRRVARAE